MTRMFGVLGITMLNSEVLFEDLHGCLLYAHLLRYQQHKLLSSVQVRLVDRDTHEFLQLLIGYKAISGLH